MPPTPTSTLNPSQAVERIREIIVGRHLDKLEQRVQRLESSGSQSIIPSQWEDRLCSNEARLEALQESLQRLSDANREEHEIHARLHREEIQRLSAQIQQVASMRTPDAVQPAINQLEGKIGTWLGNWQGALQVHLNEREQRMSEQLRKEVAILWESTESQITSLESRLRDHDQIEERFSRIAAAARALAECAAPNKSGPNYATP